MGVVVLHSRVVKYSGSRVCLYPPAEHQEELKKLHGETVPVIVVLPEKEEARRDTLEQVLAEILAALDTVTDALAKAKPMKRHVHELQQHIQKARQLLEQRGEPQ